jgi:tellurite resistance protein
VQIDDATLRTTLESIHARPTPVETTAILDVARLAAAADGRSDVREAVVLLSLSRVLYHMAGMTDMPLPQGGIDPTRLLEIGEQLVPTGARELAFAAAFLVMMSDLQLTAEEHQLANKLGEALVLDPGRAHQLAVQMESLVRSA